MKTETLVNALHDPVKKIEVKTVDSTPGEVKTKVLLYTLAYMLA